ILAAQNDIGRPPGTIRHQHRLQRGAVSEQTHFEAVVAPQPDHFDRAAVWKVTEDFARELRSALVPLRFAQGADPECRNKLRAIINFCISLLPSKIRKARTWR